MAYLRRVQFEAQVQAVAIVEVLAQVLMGGDSPDTHGITKDGKVFRRVSLEEGLARAGVTL